MKIPQLLAGLLCLALSTVAFAQTTHPADLYERAASSLDWDAEGKTDVADNATETPLNERVESYLKERSETVRLLREAMTTPAAEAEGAARNMPEVLKSLNSYRHLAKILILQSRMDASRGQWNDAADDLLADIAMARYVGSQKLLVSRLVECGIEIQVIDQQAEILTKLPVQILAGLPTKLAALPKAVTFADTLAAELEYAKTQPIPPGFLDGMTAFTTAITPDADKSPAVFAATVDAEAKKLSGNPFVKILAPSLARAREPMAAQEAKRALLVAAIDIVLHGPDAVKTTHDPFGPTGMEPFEYHPGAAGFHLSSALIWSGKAIGLDVPGM